MIQISIGDYVEEAMIKFGNYVNTSRHIPFYLDGLKPSYRRAIYAAQTLSGKKVKTATLTGEIIGKYHPHGEKSISDIIPNLVNNKIFDGQGNFGNSYMTGERDGAAAPRYTEVEINKTFRDLFGLLLDYVPFEESELTYQMPTYLPSPIPLCLGFGLQGIGIGCSVRVPMFSYKSLFNAMINNDYKLLEAPDGIILDKDNSELKELWETGRGRVCYKFLVKQYRSTDGYVGALIEGNPSYFFPNYSEIAKHVNSGNVFIRDMYGKGSKQKKVFIGRNYNVKKISIEEIVAMTEEASRYKKMYNLLVHDGSHVYQIPLKSWLQLTYDNYINLLKDYKSRNINNIQRDIDIYTWLPKVTDYLMKDRTRTKEIIAKDLNIDIDIVSAILRKSISTLLKTDSDAQIALLNKSLKEMKAFSETDKVKQLITTL